MLLRVGAYSNVEIERHLPTKPARCVPR
jgi:hypothetical protein